MTDKPDQLIEALITAMPFANWRKCHDCGHVAIYSDNVIPACCCHACKSNDTRIQRSATKLLHDNRPNPKRWKGQATVAGGAVGEIMEVFPTDPDFDELLEAIDNHDSSMTLAGNLKRIKEVRNRNE